MVEVMDALPNLLAVVDAANANLQRWIDGEHNEQDVDLASSHLDDERRKNQGND